MFNISYEGKYVDENQLKNKGKDPVGWTQFEEGENLNEAFSRGLIITLPVILFIIVLSIQKIMTIDTTYKLDVWTVVTVLTWIIVVNFMRILHEYIHAVFYPRTSRKYIYTNMKKGFFLILAGIINTNINLAMLFMSWYMIMFSSTDIYNIYYSVFKTPSHIRIVNYGLHSYWKRFQ